MSMAKRLTYGSGTVFWVLMYRMTNSNTKGNTITTISLLYKNHYYSKGAYIIFRPWSSKPVTDIIEKKKIWFENWPK